MMTTILLAASAALALFGATASEAATRLYTISGGTFEDGATFSGSFNYDDVADNYSLVSVSVTAGVLSAYTYAPGPNTFTSKNAVAGPSVAFIDSVASRYINLSFASTLAGSTGPIALRPSSGSTYFSYECNNCGTTRRITGGSVSATPAVPEPATWAMMMLGFGGMGYAMRRKTKVAARIKFA